MASRNADSVTPAQGEVHTAVPRDEPMTTEGHAPGVKVGNDAAPEFSAKTLHAGSAPPSRTFDPHPSNTISPQANNPSNVPVGGHTAASETITGATSADVHTGLGKPVQGQSSRELHGDGAEKGRKARSGLTGVGADQKDSFKEQGLDRDHVKGGRGKDETPGAEEMLPEGAETVGSELK